MCFLSVISKRYLVAVLLFSLVLLTLSCGANKPVVVGGSSGRHYSYDEIERRIRKECIRLKGSACRLNESNRGALDCSGFVRTVYKNVFDMDLPRSSREQSRQGISIARDDLRAGDLVFFRPPDYSCHVGIFLSQDRFVHVSKKKGITISQIDPLYWSKYYWTGRRVFEPGRGHHNSKFQISNSKPGNP